MSHTSRQADNHKTEEGLIPANQWGKSFAVDEGLVKRNLAEIEKSIAPCKPKIVAVTKYYGLDAVISGYKVGLRDFGESRALESVEKIKRLPKEIRQGSRFHFIGHLQTNKVDTVVEHFDYIHSVDSLKLARSISKAACSLNKREKILLQVNNAREEQKFGYDVEGLKADFKEILSLESVDVCGLMNMAPINASDELLHSLFRGLRELRDELQQEFGVDLPELSMGMSDDYLVAVQEGATIIRIGRKLFK